MTELLGQFPKGCVWRAFPPRERAAMLRELHAFASHYIEVERQELGELTWQQLLSRVRADTTQHVLVERSTIIDQTSDELRGLVCKTDYTQSDVLNLAKGWARGLEREYAPGELATTEKRKQHLSDADNRLYLAVWRMMRAEARNRGRELPGGPT